MEPNRTEEHVPHPPDGKHCPACGKDIGIWPVFCATTPNRVWCPHCGVRMRFERTERLLRWIAIAIAAEFFLGLILVGVAAYGNHVYEDATQFECLSFLVILATVAGAVMAAVPPVFCIQIWLLRNRHRLVLMADWHSRWQWPSRLRLGYVRAPVSLKVFLAAQVFTGTVCAMLVAVPIWQEMILLWQIEKAGGQVRMTLTRPDPRRWLFGGDRWMKGSCEQVFVELYGENLTDIHIAAAARAMSQLETLVRLDVKGRRITRSALGQLAPLTHLQCLVIQGPRVRDADFRHFAAMKDLKSLEIGDSPVMGHGFEQLRHLQHLRIVQLPGCSITDDGLAHIGRLPAVESIDLSNTQVTDGGLVYLAALTNLKRVQLAGSPVNGSGLVHLSKLRALNMLVLDRAPVTDAGLESIGNLAGLEFLHLNETRVTDAGLACLHGLQKLKHLALNDTLISDAAFVHLRDLTSLSSAHLIRTAVTDAGLSWLCEWPSLQVMSVEGTDVTDGGIANLKAKCPRIYVRR